MPDCTTLGCPNPGTLTGVYDDGDERARVTYCTECATALVGEFTPDAPAAPDRPGDRDQQQAAEVPPATLLDRMLYRIGYEDGLAAARAEEAARWQAAEVAPNPMTMRAVETEGFNLEASYAAAEVGAGLVPDQAAEIAESLHGLTFDELTDRIAEVRGIARDEGRAEEAARWRAKIEAVLSDRDVVPRDVAIDLRAVLDGEQR